jgi:hypothetical protein
VQAPADAQALPPGPAALQALVALATQVAPPTPVVALKVQAPLPPAAATQSDCADAADIFTAVHAADAVATHVSVVAFRPAVYAHTLPPPAPVQLTLLDEALPLRSTLAHRATCCSVVLYACKRRPDVP